MTPFHRRQDPAHFGTAPDGADQGQCVRRGRQVRRHHLAVELF